MIERRRFRVWDLAARMQRAAHRQRGVGRTVGAGALLALLLAPAAVASSPAGDGPAGAQHGAPPAQQKRNGADGAAPASDLRDLPRFRPDDPLWQDPDTIGFPQPAFDEAYQIYTGYLHLFRQPGDRSDLRAVNINTLGEVPDSSWFTNRLGVRDMEPAEIAVGPNTVGPAPGLLTVLTGPETGISPKLLVRDADGNRFVLKLDVADYPEMASSAELICSKILWAAGYNVPETFVMRLDASRLVIAEDAVYENEVGEEVAMEQADIDFWLQNTAAYADGSHRVLASKFIPGTPVGEFRFHGTRPDDPNDIFPHEHRRELRGYRVFAAWLNHDDSRATNTYDTFVGEPEDGHIVHYLLDFGSCLGSGTVVPQKTRGGNEYLFEYGPMLKSLATLGLWHRPWLDADLDVHYPAVGRLEASYFDPDLWKPEYPSPSFANMDAEDAFWAARIAARFSDDMIRAVVDAADISDPAAERLLGDLIIRRRNKVVAAWLADTPPLDAFRTRSSAFDPGGAVAQWELVWENAALRHGLTASEPDYRVQWSTFDNDRGVLRPVGETIVTRSPAALVRLDAWGAPDATGARYAVAEIGVRGQGPDGWSEPILVTLRQTSQEVSVVGIRRPR